MPGSTGRGLSADDVHGGAYVGVAGVHPLEAAVTPEAVDQVRADPSADPRGTLQDAHV